VSGVAAAVAAAGGGTATESFGLVTVDVPTSGWVAALGAGADAGAAYLDFLTAYDELDQGFAVVAHIATSDAREHVLVRTRVPRDEPVLATATGVYAGAAWHERETHEMFGIGFVGNDDLEPLLLPEGFGAHPLRKDFVLAARVSVPWPGDKDPADSTGKARRRTLPPGVPADWPTGVVGEGS
jgi:NADH-quinone oxidoreductase subunit C